MDVTKGIEGFLNFDKTLNSIQGIVDDYLPAIYLISFVLLVTAMMREFLYPETRRFMQNLVRAILLVSAISFLPSVMDWCDKAFKALAELPAARTISFEDSHHAVQVGSSGAAVTAIEEVLKSKISISASGSKETSSAAQELPQFSGNPLDLGKNVTAAWKYFVGRGVNLAWQILFAIYVLCLLLCKFIILVMQFLQKVTVMGFKLYAPIGVAEYAHPSLKGKSIAFFLTYVGVLAWPVGWSVVNAVTLGILKSMPGPVDQNFATLNLAIVLAVPVLLWVVIGHVVAPIYVQKVVMRGGGVIQGFVGTMFSAVGAGSMAFQSAALSRGADWLRNSQPPRESGRAANPSWRSPGDQGQSPWALTPENLFGHEVFGAGRKDPAGDGQATGKSEGFGGRLPRFGAGVLDAGASLVNRMGSAARLIGHAVSEGGGDGASLDYRALAAFAPQNANARYPGNRLNRSSLQARKYLSED